MAGELYKKPILFAIVAFVVIMIGTVVTMFAPMLTEEMHPRLANLKPYSALQLAGKDIYQREGCNNCHTQTVRPLKTEVMRYGEYSKAGEFAYDRPFLWGSKRTGPDLARVGGKYPDKWHEMHFESPQSMYPDSNMPAYEWLREDRLVPAQAEKRMKANGFPYTSDEIAGLSDKTELDALIAYMQVLGISVKSAAAAETRPALSVESGPNPLAGDPAAVMQGAALFEQHCSVCHGDKGEGGIGPSLIDNVFLSVAGDMSDGAYLTVISNGTEPDMTFEGRKAQGGMPSYAGVLEKNRIWALVSYVRSLQGKK